jgi:hypothetical protein
MDDSRAPRPADRSARRWNTGASLAAGLLAGALALVGALIPTGGTSVSTHAGGTSTVATVTTPVPDTDG